jgi:hypothetical protein
MRFATVSVADTLRVGVVEGEIVRLFPEMVTWSPLSRRVDEKSIALPILAIYMRFRYRR